MKTLADNCYVGMQVVVVQLHEVVLNGKHWRLLPNHRGHVESVYLYACLIRFPQFYISVSYSFDTLFVRPLGEGVRRGRG